MGAKRGIWSSLRARLAAPSIFSTTCAAVGKLDPDVDELFFRHNSQGFPEQGALLLASKPNADGGLRTNLKGRMNFCCVGTAPGHIITLSDSSFQKTIATANNRPPMMREIRL